MATCPHCDDELTERCDCGAPSCVCGYCPKCEALAVEEDAEDLTEVGEDDGE
jgi:hypothetical protein